MWACARILSASTAFRPLTACRVGSPRRRRPCRRLRPGKAAILLGFLIVSLFCAVTDASPGVSECPDHFADGIPPKLENSALSVKARDLCFAGFAVEHSGQSRTPLWSAEHLTREAVDAARSLPRRGNFHAEATLPSEEAANLADYRHSGGYDRGHLSPSSDMATPAAQKESFSLANVVPQSSGLNRNLWEWIERSVRNWAVRAGELYVVTGPVFRGVNLQALNGRVLVPTLIFKAVYDPGSRRASAYLVNNADDTGYESISVEQLASLSGIDVFPSLPSDMKSAVAPLPAPSPRFPHAGSLGQEQVSTGWWFRLLHALTGE